jgi:hypothetical protein
LGIEGKVLDVDALKLLASASTVFATKVKAETGVDLKDLDLKKPDNVSTLHTVLANVYKLDKKFRDTLLKSIVTAHKDRKPNIIFDVTLKDLVKVKTISDLLDKAGYEKQNIHIVWVVNSLDVALKQNIKRKRVVADEILITTHEGAALTMKKLVDMGNGLKKYMDGDIWFSFNKAGVDTTLLVSKIKGKKSGSYVQKANIFKVKEKGKKVMSSKDIDKEVLTKIIDYTPDINIWKK